MTPAANYASGKKWEGYQTAYTSKWTWRKKFIYMLTPLPKGFNTKIIKTFFIEDFFHYPVSMTQVGTLSCKYLHDFLKKF